MSYRYRLQIGAHNIPNAADVRVLRNVSHRVSAASPSIAECLQRHIHSNLVAELEAIANRLGDVVDLDELTFQCVLFDAC